MTAIATPVLHCIVLFSGSHDAVADPISELSRHALGELQTVGLLLFGSAHLLLAHALRGMDRGRLWPYGRGLLAVSGLALFYVTYYFATASTDTLRGPDANDPLWIVASLTGFAMGALQPGFARLSRPLGVFSAVCLGLWLWLVVLIPWVDGSWLGLYERFVGIVYSAWMIGVSYLLLQQPPAGQSASTR